MKFLFLTAALVHCALASDSPRPPSNDRHARTQGCGNALAAQLLDEQYELHRSRNPQKEAQPYKAPDAKFLNADPFAGGLDEEEKDFELTLVACDQCLDCPTTPNEKDPSQLQYDVSKDCRSCYNPKTGQNNHYVESEAHNAVRTIRKGLVYNMSAMVRTILELDEETTRIPCKEVNAETLNYICNYLEMVNGRTPKPITKPIRTKDIVQCVHEHDRADGEWIEGVYTDDGNSPGKKRVVFDIMLAANSMDIQPLLHLGACKIATLIKGESPDEIKRILGDEDDVVRGAVNDAAAGLRRRRLKKLFGSF